MKPYLTLLFLLVAIHGFAQRQNIYLLTNDGKYVHARDSADFIRIVREPDSASTLYNVMEFYMNGKLKTKGKSKQINPPEFEGQCMTYYPNGQRKAISLFSDGLRSGPEFLFYPNGKPYLVREYHNDKEIEGDLRGYVIQSCFDSLGTVLAENGNGYVKIHDDNFTGVIEEGELKNGHRDGTWKGYDGRIEASFGETYANGELIAGTATFADGSLSSYSKARLTAPYFAGGKEAYYEYLNNNIIYPAYENTHDIGGTAVISFTVEKDGTVSDVEVEKSVTQRLDNEAIRVIKKSTHWKPGTAFGKPIRVKYHVPVSFIPQI
ncbi:MAG TPA: TonB family protein [Mucilaginibacter sp.]|nr:TonB family protein [Mucilaginibacter sp.]